MQNSHMNTTKSTYSPLNSSGSRAGFFNGVTSTPLSSPNSHLKNSLFLRNKLTPLKSPPLYSLSENSNKTHTPLQNTSGPLLASTKFNVSLGTYAETKSPGLANRIVQYSNEVKQMQAPTHQPKYGSPGLFPVVHFFKQDVPTISPKPRKVTVKIASPDTSWFHSMDYNVKNVGNKSPGIQNGVSINQTATEIETRSVLDALKEISRKRIHTTNEFEAESDASKRQKRVEKVPNPPESNNNKRSREEDSPISDSQGINCVQPLAKKICVVDMLAASYTSSQLYKEKIEKGQKKKTEISVDSIEKPDPKPSKLLTVGTQTVEAKKTVENRDVEIETDPTSTSQIRSNQSNSHTTEQYGTSALIFDERRLEISRKNRLATLLSALTGETPHYLTYEKSPIPPPSSTTEPVSEPGTPPTTSPSKLVSILSPQNKPKHDKHVTFALPTTEAQIAENPAINATVNVTTASSDLPMVTSSSGTSVVTNCAINLPVDRPETPKSTLSASAVVKLNFDAPNSNEKKVDDEDMKTSEMKTDEIIVFKPPPIQATTAVVATSPPTFTFSSVAATTSANSLANVTSAPSVQTPATTTTPKPEGGFKFDLTKSPTTTQSNPSLPTPKFNFSPSGGFPTEVKALQQSTSLPGFSVPTASTAVVTPTFTFGDNKPKPVTAAAPLSFTTNKSLGDVGKSANPGFSLGDSKQLPPALVTSNNSNTFGFGASSPKAISSVAQTTQAPTFGGFGGMQQKMATSSTGGFGGTQQNPTTSSTGGFGGTQQNPATTSTGGFGVPVTTSASSAPTFGSNNFSQQNSTFGGFGSPLTTSAVAIPAFGTTTTTASSMFGAATTTANSMFGTSSPAQIAQSSGFASNTATTTTSSTLFVANPASQSFNTAPNTTTAASGIFGTASESKPFAFGSTGQSGGGNTTFGATPATKAGFNFANNAPPTNSASTFSVKPTTGFGTTFPSTSNVFGATPTTTSAASASNVFKSPTSTTFSSPPSAQFGSKPEGVAAFGNSFNSGGFGASSAGFGTPTNTSTNVPAFGNNTKFSTGFTEKFGANSSNTFGTPSSGAFPAPATQNPSTFASPSQNNLFGTTPNNNNTNNTSNAFGTTNTTNAFGSTNTSNTFGSTNANNAFANTSTPAPFAGFSTGDNSSAFAKPQTTSAVFGGAASGDSTFQFGGSGANQTFGATNATAAPPSSGQSNVFAFGTANPPPAAQPSMGVFTFGSAESKPAFNFSAGSNPAPAFGATNFNAAPAQGSFNATPFGAPVAGVFSIGSGSSTGPRSRNQLKTKRRV